MNEGAWHPIPNMLMLQTIAFEGVSRPATASLLQAFLCLEVQIDNYPWARLMYPYTDCMYYQSAILRSVFSSWHHPFMAIRFLCLKCPNFLYTGAKRVGYWMKHYKYIYMYLGEYYMWMLISTLPSVSWTKIHFTEISFWFMKAIVYSADCSCVRLFHVSQ